MERQTSARSGCAVLIQTIVFALWAVFVAAWPNIITNLLSDVLSRVLHIDTTSGTRLVIMLTVVTGLLYVFFQVLRGVARRFAPGAPEVGATKMQLLMYGALFSLSIALSLLCEGRLAAPFTITKAMEFIGGIAVPILGGAVARHIVASEHEHLEEAVVQWIDSLLQRTSRVTQRMIIGYIQDYRAGAVLPQEVLSSFVRTKMMQYVELERHRGAPIVLDSRSDPDNWKILKDVYADRSNVRD